MDIASLCVVCLTIVIVAAIVGYVTLMHKDFVETERTTDYTKIAVNDDTIGNQIYTITRDPVTGAETQEHQNTPKQVTTKIKRRNKNC